MARRNLFTISKGVRNTPQEVTGVVVVKRNKEFVFNFSTSVDPEPHELESLKIFRNKFITELEKLNIILGHLPR